MSIVKKILGFVLGDVLPIAAIVGGFWLLRIFYFDFAILPGETYTEGHQIFVPWFTTKLNLLVLLVLSLPLLMPKATWRSGDLKIFQAPLLLLVLILAARYALSPFNLFLGEEYFVERIALLVLALASGLHTVFLPTFMVGVFLFVGQLEPGVPNALGHENQLPLLLSLIVLHAFLLVRAVCPPTKMAHLILVMVTLQCAHYFHSGIEKLFLGPDALDWAMNTRIDALFVSHYLGGWLPFRSEESVLFIASKLKEWNLEISICILVLEISTIIALFSKNFTWLIFYLLVGFHLGVFFTCGIFFWPWMVVNLILLMLISRTDWHSEFNSFSLGRSLIGVLLVVFSAGHFTGFSYYHPVRLAWFDSPYGQIYKLKIVDSNEETLEVPHFVMAPYHYQFIQNEFSYANDRPQLAYHSGMVRESTPEQSLELVKALSEARSLNDVRALYTSFGDERLDEEKKSALSHFLKTYFGNANKELTRKGDDLATLRLGPLKWAFPHLGEVKEVRLEYYDALYTDAGIEKSEPQTLLVAAIAPTDQSDETERREDHPLKVLAQYIMK